MVKYTTLLFFLVFNSVNAAEVNPIFGKYVYSGYKVSFLDGRVLTLSQLGTKSAQIEFRPNMTIRMEMKMFDGTTRISEAKILESHHQGNIGSIFEKWPEMSYPVTLYYKRNAHGLSYVISFNNHADPMRYGGREESVLTKISSR
ncbi:MAG: hypothetical protein H7Z73_03740 [Candidatus Saccharibacteria bacterium]|nr:hypothetical protein [Moraxellaceae bacterium]